MTGFMMMAVFRIRMLECEVVSKPVEYYFYYVSGEYVHIHYAAQWAVLVVHMGMLYQRAMAQGNVLVREVRVRLCKRRN